MSDNTITIEVPERTALAAHITELQRVITARNKHIAELEARLESEGESEYMQRVKQKAYARGYEAAAGTLMEASRKFKDVLDNVNKRAFAAYLEGDRLSWDKSKYEEATNA